MTPLINLDDPAAARTIGRRVAPAALKTRSGDVADVQAWRKAFPTPFVPKGLYRFNSHQEADEWMWKMITRQRS